MVGFVQALFESGLKDNPSLEFAVITGCLRVLKEINVSANAETLEKRPRRFSQTSLKGDVLFTGLNNLEIISVMSHDYDEFFGLTDAEVRKMCDDFDVLDKYEMIKDWYNEYVFGKENIYNRWSIIRYVKALHGNSEELPKAY